MYDIAWNKRALKALHRLGQDDVNKIYHDVQLLRGWPDCKKVVKLKNHMYSYRLRAGRYRIFFEVDNKVRIVLIEEVRKRDERTY